MSMIRPVARRLAPILFSVVLVHAEEAAPPVATVGQPFPAYSLEDPHGNAHTLAETTRFVIVSSEKAASQSLAAWLKTEEPDFLETRQAEFVSDITPMPAVITKLFARPKMKKYPFKMYLADDKNFAKTYPARKGHIAVFVLDGDQNLAAMEYVTTPEEVKALVAPPEASPAP